MTHDAPAAPGPEQDALERRRALRRLWIGAAVFGLAMGLVLPLALYSVETGVPADQRTPVARLAALGAFLAPVSAIGFGLFLRLATGSRVPAPPPGTTAATRRQAYRALRHRRPTGDPLVDETARRLALHLLRQPPWFALYLPLGVFLLGFAANAWAVLERFPWPDGLLAVPWPNLAGLVLFPVLLTVVLPKGVRDRRNAHAFLRAPERAAGVRPPRGGP
ncbi:hypothetical protein ACFVWN_04305 [Nocardiopsis flavescens]|uniref:hypothetical protein n=1 Tax=Nocardiopsis flavescens TaxID=758803 RepID=UPI00364CC9E9